jgi:hypothetical protein
MQSHDSESAELVSREGSSMLCSFFESRLAFSFVTQLKSGSQIARTTIGAFVAAFLSVLAVPASGQLYYLPFELNLPNQVDPYLFGESLAIGDGVFYVGGEGDGFDFFEGESAVYEFSSTTFEYIRTIESPGNSFIDRFGNVSEYYDGQLLVGALNGPGTLNDMGNPIETTGAVYLFDATTGALQHTFYEDDNLVFNSAFGRDISINDVAIIIGGTDINGTGQVFAYSAVNYNLLVVLDPPASNTYTNYGYQVDHNDDYLVVSAPGDTFFGDFGFVYVYDFTSGALLYTLASPNGHEDQNFGFSIDLDGSNLLVGSLRSSNFMDPIGKAYIYDLTTGLVSHTFISEAEHNGFGVSVDLDGDTAVIGAPYDDDRGDNTGAVYVYNINTEKLIDKALPNTSLAGTWFGRKVQIDNGVILAQANDQSLGSDNRSVYFLEQFCKPDINLDGSLDFFDVSAFLKFRIDFNEDGNFDFFDISSFLQSYNTGCP